MPAPEVHERVRQRLQALYEQERDGDQQAVTRYYRSGRGYYPPADAGPERDHFGICVVTVDGAVYEAGDAALPFPLHSLSKVFAHAYALQTHGRERVLKRVGVEPSGDAFNSISFDERHNRPHNPMVNAGALVTSELIEGDGPVRRGERILEFLRHYAGNDGLVVDEDTFRAELATADRNRATAYLMRSNGMLSGDVEETLALYLRQCSVHVTCLDLAVMAATLANGCVNPRTGVQVLARRRVRDVLSVMYTCGMYDYAGQWAYEIGVPAKSGVSGGIMAVIPGKMGIAVYSPGLDDYGNSVRGVRVCEQISARLGLHVFATEAEDTMLGAV